jgi:hypothetical protein
MVCFRPSNNNNSPAPQEERKQATVKVVVEKTKEK